MANTTERDGQPLTEEQALALMQTDAEREMLKLLFTAPVIFHNHAKVKLARSIATLMVAVEARGRREGLADAIEITDEFRQSYTDTAAQAALVIKHRIGERYREEANR